MFWHHPVFALHIPSHLGTHRLSSITGGFPTQRASNADRIHVMTSSCLCTTHLLSPGYTQAVFHHEWFPHTKGQSYRQVSMLWNHPVFALHISSHLGTHRLSSITSGFPTQRASHTDRFPCYETILSLHYTSPLTWVHTGCLPSPVVSPHKGPVMQTGFHVMTSSCLCTTHPLSPGYTQAVFHHQWFPHTKGQ